MKMEKAIYNLIGDDPIMIFAPVCVIVGFSWVFGMIVVLIKYGLKGWGFL